MILNSYLTREVLSLSVFEGIFSVHVMFNIVNIILIRYLSVLVHTFYKKNRKIFEISFDFFKIYAILYSVKEIRGFASDGHIEKKFEKSYEFGLTF